MLLTAGVMLAACGDPAPRGPAKPTPPHPGATPFKQARLVLGMSKKADRDASAMVLVPAGFFPRGSVPSEGEPDEAPRRNLYLDGYYLDRYTVRVGQYKRCVAAKVCSAPDTAKGCNWPRPPRPAGEEQEEPLEGEEPEREMSDELKQNLDNHPVTCVSHFQAEEYCRWAGKRLPTEAEWEKAARGTTGRKHPWGDQPPTCERANLYLNKKKYCRGRGETAAVNDYEDVPSPYGVVQMSGNVYQWVTDWYGKDYYRKSDERNPLGPLHGKYRVVRGGSWFSPAMDLRAAARGPLPPGMQLPYLGFRCAGWLKQIKPWSEAEASMLSGDVDENPALPHRLTGVPQVW